MPETMNKTWIRKIALEKRDALSVKEKQFYSKIICQKLESFLINKTVFSYYPFKSEVDVSSLNKKYHVCYPFTYKDGSMKALLPDGDHFIISPFGIKEPDPDFATMIDKNDIDVIIVPLLGFDKNKNRIGYGGGYYDRYLKNCKGLKIAVAFEVQRFDSIVTEKNDVRMDIIITEKEIII